MAKTRILAAGSDEGLLERLKDHLSSAGYSVRLASNAKRFDFLLDSYKPDIALVRAGFEGASAEAIIEKAGTDPKRRGAVVLLVDEDQVDEAIEAIKKGADDYCALPLDLDRLDGILKRVRRDYAMRLATAELSARLGPESLFGPFVGASEPMRKVYDLIRVLASNETSVLITGESGTGKELVARTIHQLSARSAGPLVVLNCAAFPEELIESQVFGHEKGAFTGASRARKGSFEAAHGGILFLDEIAEMPASLQPKLLRVLETGQVRRLGSQKQRTFDVRVLAATNRDPREAISEGLLREDLYYRINVFTVHLPPLRQRKSDIPLLAQFFVERFNQKHGFKVEGVDEEAQRLLRQYDWPGNVRELKNMVERAVVMASRGFIQPGHLPAALHKSLGTDPSGQPRDVIEIPVGSTLSEAEREVLRQTLLNTDYNKSKTARILDIDVKTVRSKIKTYGL